MLTIVLLPVVKDLLADKVRDAIGGPAMWVDGQSNRPAPGCAALREPLQGRDRAELKLDSDVEAVMRRRGGAWTSRLSISISLRGGTGAATVSAIDVRPRGAARPPLTAALACHPSAGTLPAVRLTANLDATQPVVKSDGRPYATDGKWITVAPGEQIPIHLLVSITGGYREFDVVVWYKHKGMSGGKGTPLPVYDGDPKLEQPFRVTGVAPSYQSIYVKSITAPYREATPREVCGWVRLEDC